MIFAPILSILFNSFLLINILPNINFLVRTKKKYSKCKLNAVIRLKMQSIYFEMLPFKIFFGYVNGCLKAVEFNRWGLEFMAK